MVNEETLRLATERLVTQFQPQRVILFGSQARESADTHSDVDLLVVCPIDPERASRRALMVAMDRALAGLGFGSSDSAVSAAYITSRSMRHPRSVGRRTRFQSQYAGWKSESRRAAGSAKFRCPRRADSAPQE